MQHFLNGLKKPSNYKGGLPAFDKDPTNFTWITYAWVTVLASWGGLVSFIGKVRSGEVRAFNLVELIGELCTSAFTGVLTFLLCQAAGMNGLLTAALVGISGHMGSRCLFMFERWATKKFRGFYETTLDTESGNVSRSERSTREKE